MEKNVKIHCEHLILCEGVDEKLFLISFLNSKESKEFDKRFEQNIQVIDFGGNEELPVFLSVLKITPGFEMVKSILVVRDAEKSYDKAKMDVRTALVKAGFMCEEPGTWYENDNIRIGYLLFPTLDDKSEKGTLEDLCSCLVRDDFKPDYTFENIDFLMNKFEEDGVRKFKYEFKTRLHTFFAMTNEFVGMKIGEASKAGAFDWKNKRLDYFKKFISEVLNISDDCKE